MKKEERKENLHSSFEDDLDKTKPLWIPGTGFKRGIRRWWWIAPLLLVAVGLFLLVSKKEEKAKPALDRLTVQLKINEITALEAVARQEQKKAFDLFSQLGAAAGIDATGWDILNPTAEQRETLKQKALQGSVPAADFLAALSGFQDLKTRIRKLESLLETPHVVAPGEIHFQISLDFLVRSGVKEDEARRILQETRLTDPVLPGYKVWNFCLEDGFCTFVTQGDGPVMPEEAARQAQERQRLEKEQAIGKLNSLAYLIGTVSRLESRGILIGGFLKTTRLGEIKPEYFRRSIDLRSQRSILISSRAVGLKSISGIVLFPRDFREGKDYEVHISGKGRWASVSILKVDSFRGMRIVIAVE